MSVAFFQISLSVQPQSGGTAEIVVPEVLRDLNYGFVIVKEGAEEGIVRVEEAKTALDKIVADPNCTELKSNTMKTLYESYPKPKLKQQYKTQVSPPQPPQEADERNIPGPQFETDEQGNPIVITLQTVRSGFYLIDVPILPI